MPSRRHDVAGMLPRAAQRWSLPLVYDGCRVAAMPYASYSYSRSHSSRSGALISSIPAFINARFYRKRFLSASFSASRWALRAAMPSMMDIRSAQSSSGCRPNRSKRFRSLDFLSDLLKSVPDLPECLAVFAVCHRLFIKSQPLCKISTSGRLLYQRIHHAHDVEWTVSVIKSVFCWRCPVCGRRVLAIFLTASVG